MSDIIETVPASPLPEMLDEAFYRASQYNYGVSVEKDDVTFDGNSDRTAVVGTATVNWNLDRGNSEEFSFEVNLGTHKDEIIVFDPLEVVIDFDGGDDE